MKILSILSAAIIFLSVTANAQDTSKTKYPVVVSFQSICCGVPTEKPVVDFINAFKKKHKKKLITANHIGPMGKEGEYYLAFSLRELNKKQKKLFVTGINKITKLPDDNGILTIKESMEINTAEIPRRASIKKITF